jgi:predicted nucleic acid-binding Zn ribbon protein
MSDVYCSTCRAAVATDEEFCRECGLAIPAVQRKQRQSLLLWVIIIAAPILMFLYTFGKIDQHQGSVPGSAHEAAQSADDTLFSAALDAMSTPEGFAIRCGKPERVLDTSDGAILSYPLTNKLGRIGTEQIVFHREGPVMYFRTALHHKMLTDSAENALATIGCKVELQNPRP